VSLDQIRSEQEQPEECDAGDDDRRGDADQDSRNRPADHDTDRRITGTLRERLVGVGSIHDRAIGKGM
jgi:hypothetical protein